MWDTQYLHDDGTVCCNFLCRLSCILISRYNIGTTFVYLSVVLVFSRFKISNSDKMIRFIVKLIMLGSPLNCNELQIAITFDTETTERGETFYHRPISTGCATSLVFSIPSVCLTHEKDGPFS